MRILFCRITNMKYYKGGCEDDKPIKGGEYVEKYGEAGEEYNFEPIKVSESNKFECFGFVEPKRNKKGKINQFHLENLEGCSRMKNEEFIEDVLVVWCTTLLSGGMAVVGWYKNATVFRKPKKDTFTDVNVYYNVRANAEDCTLIPENMRTQWKWSVPLKAKKRTYGFGSRPMIWYPEELEAKNYLKELVKNIDEYDGENWLYKYPNDNNKF